MSRILQRLLYTGPKWGITDSLPSSNYLLVQPSRSVYYTDPGTLEKRLFKAITKPVIPPQHVSAAERRIRHQEEVRLRMENNPYKAFLVERAREEFFQRADGRMLLIIQALPQSVWERFSLKRELFTKGITFCGFPVPILREAAVGTRWQVFADVVLKTDCPNAYLIADAQPDLCKFALSLLQKNPFYLLLGGVIDYRIMTVQGLRDFADLFSLGGLKVAQSRLVGLLEASRGQRALQQLTSHQSDIVFGLKRLASPS